MPTESFSTHSGCSVIAASGSRVSTPHRLLWVAGPHVGSEHLVNGSRELGARLGTVRPILQLAPSDAVFSSVRPTVSWLIESAIPSFPTMHASRRRDQIPEDIQPDL